jgi:hypothetical protein
MIEEISKKVIHTDGSSRSELFSARRKQLSSAEIACDWCEEVFVKWKRKYFFMSLFSSLFVSSTREQGKREL